MTSKPQMSKVYSNRSSAARAAKAACRKALRAPNYQAFEGPDFELHPANIEHFDYILGMSERPHKFLIRGPAAEA